MFPLLEWLEDATITSLSPLSVNAKFVPGAGDHPSTWSALGLGKTKGCRISDQAALKDCSTFFFKDSPKSLELGGDDNVVSWLPKIVNVPLLNSNRELQQFYFTQTTRSMIIHFSFLLQVTERLNLIYRSVDRIVVGFVPTFGGANYSMEARNAKYGYAEGKCETTSYSCEVMGLKPANLYTLCLRAYRRNGYMYCNLRAIPLSVSTLPEGKPRNSTLTL